jgi:uncharacterized protein YcaQ
VVTGRTATLSAAQARRIALVAQGFAAPRPTGRIDRRHVRRVFDRVGLIQIDSVNVLVRSQELPLFARLGPHPRDLLQRMANDGELFEYWAHEASLLPVEVQPLFRFRMGSGHWVIRWTQRLEQERPGYVDAVFAEVEARGPLSAGELEDAGGVAKGPWWGWTYGKRALELLFHQGRVAVRRRPNFEREYDLPARILPASVLAVPTPSEDESRAGLMLLAGKALGIGTARDLADYYRLNIVKTRPIIEALASEGVLEKVAVDGWREPGYLFPGSSVPRRVQAQALLSPFDSLVWERARTERVFGFRYRIEIYTPQHKRVHGYYVLPFLLGESLVARVDLKSDRAARVLRVQGAYAEEGQAPGPIAEPLAEELVLMAGWLGLDDVVVGERGDLAVPLQRALTRA